MTLRGKLTRRSRLSLAMLGLTAFAAMAILWLSPVWRATPTAAKPAEPELGPMPRSADPVPLYAEVEPAKNPIRMMLQDDGRKVVGWISGAGDFAGYTVTVRINDEKTADLKIQKGNTFTWEYKLDKPTKATFYTLLGWRT